MYIQLLLIQSLGIWERSVCPELQRGGVASICRDRRLPPGRVCMCTERQSVPGGGGSQKSGVRALHLCQSQGPITVAAPGVGRGGGLGPQVTLS